MSKMIHVFTKCVLVSMFSLVIANTVVATNGNSNQESQIMLCDLSELPDEWPLDDVLFH